MSSNTNPQSDNNTRLEALFGALRERESLLTDDEIRNIVRTEAIRKSAPQKAFRSAGFPQRLFTKKPMLISSAIAVVFASATLFTTLVWKPSVANTNSQLKQPDFQVTQEPIASSNIRLEGIRKKPSAANTNSQLKQPDFQATQESIASSSISLEGIRNPKREIVQTKSDKETIAETPRVSKIPLNTAGIHFLELTPTEASRFGLLVNDTLIALLVNDPLIRAVRIQEGHMRSTNPKNQPMGKGSVLQLSYTELSTFIEVSNEIPANMSAEKAVKESPFLTTSSTSKDGIMLKRSYTPQADSLIRNLSSAIALGFDVRKNKSIALKPENWGGYVVLWYRNTPEVIAALPDRYRIPLERELAAAQKYSSLCEIPNREEREELERVIAGKPFLETWRSCAGALTAKSIAPNPAQNEATVRFSLSVPRSVSAALHDIRGQHLEILHTAQNFGTGEHTLSVNLTKYIAGMYLLVLTTAQGEQTVQRVMIEK